MHELAVHPSILAWNLVDEVAENGHSAYELRYVRSLGAWLHRYDPERLVAIEVWGTHPPAFAGPIYAGADAVSETDYTGWYDDATASASRQRALMRARLSAMERTFPGKVLVISEFGAEANTLNPPGRPGSYSFQSQLLQRHISVYERDPKLSPDGKLVAFRRGWDLYTLDVAAGAETRLTTDKGLDDGPEYSPDGKFIYFNSVRTGTMQIWRMKPDGSGQEQVFSDDLNNWFPHISPDGQWMVFLTYGADVTGHPENKDVMLRVMALADKKITVLAKLFGGQGTINVPSWSPDSKRLAFVSYMLIPPE